MVAFAFDALFVLNSELPGIDVGGTSGDVSDELKQDGPNCSIESVCRYLELGSSNAVIEDD